MAQRFTITPNPANAGNPAIVCYAFAGIDPPETVTATIDYSPSTIPDDQVDFDPKNPCVTIQIPPGATSGILIDSTGNSDSLGFAC